MKLAVLFAVPAILSACAASEGYPSLAKRPIELTNRAPSAPPTAPPPAAIDPALAARVTASLDKARASQAPFAAALAKAKPAVDGASGSEAGSERWIAGQMAASSVEPLREPAAAALSDLEEELRLATGTPERAAIEAAIVEASEIVTEQQRESAALAEQLPD
jgi:hypothetical protein